MSAGRRSFPALLTRGEASGFCERGVLFFENPNPPLACGSRPPCQGVKKRKQSGFTYLGFLLAVAVTGAGLAAFAEIASHAMQREKEAELLFRGNQYREAIAAYYRIDERYPQSLDQLILNKGFSLPVRHLRKLYADPMTGAADWGLVQAPDGGIMGVHSRSEAAPIKTGNFLARDMGFEDAQAYSDWKFVHTPSTSGPRPPTRPR